MKVLEAELNKRTTEELKKDAKVAMDSQEEHATVIFVSILNVLEDRLTEEEYTAFEEGL